MSNGNSLIKAKYAMTILKVAKGADRQTASQLVEGLGTDSPELDDRAEIAKAHANAIEAFGTLTASIRGPTGGSPGLWDAAFLATERWRALLE